MLNKPCERYESDPILDTSMRSLKKTRDEGRFTLDALEVSINIRTVLNDLDGMLIGVRQGF